MKVFEIERIKEKVFVGLVFLGLALGNMALSGICFFGMYEPKRPSILDDEL